MITQNARDAATKLAHQCGDTTEAEQTYQNVLAAYVVHNYLKILGIKSQLQLQTSVVSFLTKDTAAIQVLGLGQVECVTVNSTEQTGYLPPERQIDRLGYVFLSLSNDQEAHLLGFVERIEGDRIHLDQLTSPAQLSRLFKDIQITASLRQWLEGIYQDHWQPLDTVLTNRQLSLIESLSEEDSAQRVRVFNFDEVTSEIPPVALCVSAEQEDEGLAVRVQVYPVARSQPTFQKLRFIYDSSEVLTPNLELSLFSKDKNLIKKVVSRTQPLDDYIQLPVIHASDGERFSITVTLGHHSIQQYFRT